MADIANVRAAHQAAWQVGLHLPLLTCLTKEDAAGAEDKEPMLWVRLDDPFADGGDAAVPSSPAPTSPRTEAAYNVAAAQNPEKGRVDSTAWEGANGAESNTDAKAGKGGEGSKSSEGVEDDGFDNECGQVHVEEYPNQRAGQPIDDSRAKPINLREYMHARGDFSNVDYFDISKTLMTTKLTDERRKVHLNSRVVSSP